MKYRYYVFLLDRHENLGGMSDMSLATNDVQAALDHIKSPSGTQEFEILDVVTGEVYTDANLGALDRLERDAERL